MHVTVKDHNTESTLLIDNENQFKGYASQHKIICLVIATHIRYKCPMRLLIIGGGELQYKEGTQGDPTPIGAYAFSI